MKKVGTDRLREQVNAYFSACDATAERIEQKNGGIAYRQVPYTLAGLSAATARSERSILLAAEGQGGKGERDILSAAIRRIARHLSERALMGELQASVALAMLKELSGADGENDGEERRLTVVLDDREGWSD